ncbi:MAG: T9SS type A sorting domain-containing protein [Bacteroidetes bacterium]|nr:T9SS type A sorting domain-containing protein [Bacteroidota bacterium]
MKIRFTLSIFTMTFMTISLYGQTVSTYAGTPAVAGNTSVAANRLQAQFTQPYGIDLDSKGNMWISEQGNSIITMILASNDEVRIRVGGVGLPSFMDGSGTISRFNHPGGIAVGPNDEIYVADIDNHAIRKISAFQNLGNAQAVSVFAGKHDVKPGSYTSYSGYADGNKDEALFLFPSDVAVDASGNVFVADRGNHVIRKIDPSGNVSTFAGQQGMTGSADGAALSATFNYPEGVFVKGNDVYVADKLNSKIRKISGGQVSTVLSNLWTPSDVYVDEKNDIYIVDLHRVWKFEQTYAGSTQAQTSGFINANGTEARFNTVRGITKSGKSLFVADMENHIIRRIADCSGWVVSITKNSYLLTATPGKFYQWFKDGNPISAANGQTYTVSSTGNYKVEVENNDECKDMSAEIYVEVVSIPENDFIQTLSNYPNPVFNTLYLNLKSGKASISGISITDLTGRELMAVETNAQQNLKKEIDMSTFEAGMYLLVIKSNKGYVTRKLIKQ